MPLPQFEARQEGALKDSRIAVLFIVATQLHYFVTFRDQHHACHANKQAVFHYARHIAELLSERWRVRDLAEAAIENVMAFVRDKRAVVGLAKFHRRS